MEEERWLTSRCCNNIPRWLIQRANICLDAVKRQAVVRLRHSFSVISIFSIFVMSNIKCVTRTEPQRGS